MYVHSVHTLCYSKNIRRQSALMQNKTEKTVGCLVRAITIFSSGDLDVII